MIATRGWWSLSAHSEGYYCIKVNNKEVAWGFPTNAVPCFVTMWLDDGDEVTAKSFDGHEVKCFFNQTGTYLETIVIPAG